MRKIVWLVLALLGAAVFYYGFNLLGKSQSATNWPQVNGTVLSSAVTSDFSSDSTMYDADIRYQYSVADQVFIGDKISYGDFRSSESSDAQRIVNKYHPGQKVAVYYNPENPSVSVLEPGKIGGIFILFSVGFLFVFVGLFMFISFPGGRNNKANFQTKGVDPSRIDDPIGKETSWSPLERGGAGFQTHKLVSIGTHRIEFRTTLAANSMALIFFSLGLAPAVIWFPFSSDGSVIKFLSSLIPFMFGVLFMAFGVYLFFYIRRPITFDKMDGYFRKGSLAFQSKPLFGLHENAIRLDAIHALQIIAEQYADQKGLYSYELNLVLRDASRLNVVDHGNLNQLREDADTLAKFLGKPVWDAAERL